MKLLILTSARGPVLTGNRGTARQWMHQLELLGHDVELADTWDGQAPDGLIALHAGKSAAAIAAFKRAHPDHRVAVVATGTDIYPQPGPAALAAFRRADRIVVLQPRARERVPAELRSNVVTIIQSAVPPAPTGEVRSTDPFGICVVAHLREIKDPLRAAAASRRLPSSSRIRVSLAGASLDDELGRRAEREQAENPRFTWRGEIPAEDALRLIAESQLLVVSSFHEGGGRVIGEAVVAGTPVLAARNDAAGSLLGDDYPGLFAAGNAEQLGDLMLRAERDDAFLTMLRNRTRKAQAQFEPHREREALRALVTALAK